VGCCVLFCFVFFSRRPLAASGASECVCVCECVRRCCDCWVLFFFSSSSSSYSYCSCAPLCSLCCGGGPSNPCRPSSPPSLFFFLLLLTTHSFAFGLAGPGGARRAKSESPPHCLPFLPSSLPSPHPPHPSILRRLLLLLWSASFSKLPHRFVFLQSVLLLSSSLLL